MSKYDAIRGKADSIRRGAWNVGGIVLLALGGACFAVALGGLMFAGGGVAFLLVALPPLAAGYSVLRAMRGARVFGFVVAVLYGVTAGYVTTTPLRGLTPPPGQGVTLDPGSVFVVVAFLASALLIVLGSAGRQPAG